MQLIYSGRHGDVYKLKKLAIKYSTNPYELQILPTLHHKHVIHIHNVKDNGLEMDYIPLNLAQVIALEMPLPYIKLVIKQIASALNYIHSKDIKHHDLKPENIMVDNGCIKLIDFPSMQSTINYMSPEECFGGGITKEQDIWALGCIVFEMYHNKSLFSVNGEIPLICEIFKLFGTPTKETWPEWDSFPDHGKLLFNHLQPQGISLPSELRIANEMLQYTARPPAKEIYGRMEGKDALEFNAWILDNTRLEVIGKGII